MTEEQFQAELAQMQATLTQTEEKIALLKIELSDEGARCALLEQKITTLEATISESEKKAASAVDDLKAALELNDELQKELSLNQKQTKTVSQPTVEHEGKKYRITRPRFVLPGHGTFTAEQAVTKPEVVAELLKRGSKVISEL